MYKIRLQQFEGPLDLLLFFIRRDELDIQDIPIASIADEFLEYVTTMEEVDLDGVGDFLYMAALLINIKTKMLLPSMEVDDDGEPIDPRTELIERLLEYVRFKEASDNLEVKYDERSRHFTRGAPSIPEGGESVREDMVDATVFDLVSALRRVLTALPEEVFHQIEAETYSVEGQRAFLMSALELGERVSFVEFVREHTKSFIITTFLALLEMARLAEIDIFLSSDELDFFIELMPEADEETNRALDDANSIS